MKLFFRNIQNWRSKEGSICGVSQLIKENFSKNESHTKDVYYKFSVIINGRCKYSRIFVFTGNYLLTVCTIFSKNSKKEK